jgi:hypothetical protein
MVMKKYIILISIFLTSLVLHGQSIGDIRNENNSEIKKLKKVYFQTLQQNQDARIFSITEDRNAYSYSKFENRRQNAALNFKKDSILRKKLSIKNQNMFNVKLSMYTDSITNALG